MIMFRAAWPLVVSTPICQSSTIPAVRTIGPAIAFGRVLPLRETHWPETKLAVTAPSIRGVSTTPDEVADVPITPWTNSGTKEIVPNIAIPTRAMQARQDATTRFLSRENGRIGSGTPRSYARNDANAATATHRATTTCALVHAYRWPPQTSPSSSDVVLPPRRRAPTQSIERSVCGARRGIVTEI